MALVSQQMEKKTENPNDRNSSDGKPNGGKPSVAVVILNWNGRYFLEKFLPSVYNSTFPELRFVIGDNGSTDESVAFVRENYPNIELVCLDQNHGFAGGYNRVLSKVDADYFVLLNSDVEVTPGWIEPVINWMETQGDVAACQPKILSFHERNKFEHAGAAGGYIDAYGYPFCRGRLLNETEEDRGQYNDYQDVFWATGAAFFVRKSCWVQAGGFDDDFFAHMEEIDLCWRLKRLGYRISYCPDSVVYHVGGGTLAKSNPWKTRLNFRNNLFMLQKNLPFWRAVWVISIRLWLDFFALLHFLIQGNFKDALAVHQAHKAFFGSFFKTAKKRNNPRKLQVRSGYYPGSMVWNFYLRGKRKFSELFLS